MRTTNQSTSEVESFWSAGPSPAPGAGDWGWGGGHPAFAIDALPTCNPNDIDKEPPPENMPVNTAPPVPCDENGDASVCPPEPGFPEHEEEDEFWDDVLEVGHGVAEGTHTVLELLEHGMWGILPPVFPDDLGKMGKEPPGA